MLEAWKLVQHGLSSERRESDHTRPIHHVKNVFYPTVRAMEELEKVLTKAGDHITTISSKSCGFTGSGYT